MIGFGALLVFLAALIFPGIISITKAKLGGRKGPGIFQPLFDIGRLLRKGNVYSTTTSAIFKIAPIIYFASIVVALLFLPFNGEAGFFSFDGDFVFLAYLLAIGKFLMIISAMDTGSGFEGMGANREALYSMLVEPAFFILFGSLALLTSHTSFIDLYNHVHFGSYLSYLMAGLCIYLLIQIAMVENSRFPVDDPKTHLELTMIHEVMVLDNSGFDLGLMQLGSALKFSLYGGLISNFLFLKNLGLGTNIAIFFLVQICFAIIVGLLESFRARLKMEKIPQWIVTLSTIALVTFFTALIFTHKFILN
jgi:formate hydrogenlyase subunit 4